MMRILIPSDSDFDYMACKRLYEKNYEILNENSSFEQVINNTFFYSFYDNQKLSLCVYFFVVDDKLWVNGFGIRKNHLFNKKCFNLALTWFNCDIWAQSTQKPAIYGITACGFKKVDGDIYKFSHKDCNTI